MRMSSCVFKLSRYFDAVIVGGGMVGLTAACCLAANPAFHKKSVLLIENSALQPLQTNEMFSNRVSALNPGSRALFEEIGVWNYLDESNRIKTVKQLQIWDACATSRIHFEQENFETDIAYILENSNIVNACLSVLADKSNIKLLDKTKISKLTLPDHLQSLVEIDLSDGSRVYASLLIGADGFNSCVRASMNTHYISWSYNQKGVVATLELTTTGRNDIAWQRFTPTGPVALLPLDDRHSSLVWTTTPEDAHRLLALSDEEFVDSLNNILWDSSNQNETVNSALKFFERYVQYVVPHVSKVDQLPPTIITVAPKSRAAFPLGFGHASHYVRVRSVLIGDASHRVHPLAGQGVNLGFGDCLVLNKILGTAIENGADIGSLLYLKDYESQRQLKNVPIMMTMDFLNRLYRTNFTPVVLARSLGLSAMNHAELIKQIIVTRASSHC